MAVQKSKKSRARRGTRRAHDNLTNTPATIEENLSGELRLRHQVSEDGFYKGVHMVSVRPKK